MTTLNAQAIPTEWAGRKALILVFLVIAYLYWVALYLYAPTLPLYLQTKTPDLVLIGSALSMYGFWMMAARLPVGILVDWAGRSKPFIIVLMLIIALGDWAMGSAANISNAALGRALTGVAGSCWVPLVVLVGSLFPPKELLRATALVAFVGTFGRITATAANGWLNGSGGYPLAFKIAAAAALVGAVLAFFLPNDSHPKVKPSPTRLWGLFKRQDVLLPSLLNGVAHVGEFVGTFTFIPLLARQKGASDVAVGLLQSFDLAILLTGNLISPRLVRIIGKTRVIALGLAAMILGLVGAALAPNLPVLFVFQACIGMGLGLIYPLLMSMSIDQVNPEERSTAMGIHQSVYSLGIFVGPWASGLIAAQLGIPAMFAIVAAFMVVGGVLGLRRLRIKNS